MKVSRYSIWEKFEEITGIFAGMVNPLHLGAYNGVRGHGSLPAFLHSVCAEEESKEGVRFANELIGSKVRQYSRLSHLDSSFPPEFRGESVNIVNRKGICRRRSG